MSTTTQKTNFQVFTRLPVEEISATDKPTSSLVVQTPHKGTVVIDLKEFYSAGFFTRRQGDVLDSKVIRKLQTLEREAKNHLLSEWLEH